MPFAVRTAEVLSPSPSVKPLPAHLTSTQKPLPGILPSPLDASFLRHDNAEWEANNFLVTCFSYADSTVPMRVILFDFADETPDN